MSTTMKRTTLFAVATTIGATCFLPVAAPAQAAGCGDFYAFPDAPADAPPFHGFNFNVELVQDNGIHVYLQTTDNEVQQAMYLVPDAPLVGETHIAGILIEGGDPNPAGDPVRGAADGGLHGRAIEFKVRWQNEFTNVYTGQVNDDGSASGTTINNTGTPFLGGFLPGDVNTWHSAFADFRCAQGHTLGRAPVGEKPEGRTLGRVPVGDDPALQREIDPALQQQILGSLPQVSSNTRATAVQDVDVYNAKNEPDGAGQVVGVLRAGTTVDVMGNCAPSSWCEVSGDSVPVPGQHGWVWGYLFIP